MPHTTENQHVSDEEIARLYLSCKSLKKVAALINRSMKYVRETLEKLGVPINKRGIPKGTILPGKLTLKQREELRADLRAGKTVKPGPQNGRASSEPLGGAATLHDVSLYDGSIIGKYKPVAPAPAEPAKKPGTP